MSIEAYSNEELLAMGKTSAELTAFWSGPLGESLRALMADVTQDYLTEVMQGDPHAFKGIEAVSVIAKRLGDQKLYEAAIKAEFTRRHLKTQQGA